MTAPSTVSRADPTKLRPRRHILGLDLGQRSDPSALAVLEDTDAWFEATGEWSRFYALRHLQRWPLKTKYPAIVADVEEMLRSPRLVNPVLVIDATGVGGAVADMFDESSIGVPTRRALITNGHKVHMDTDGTWLVPKRELVSVLQSLLQRQKLTVANVPDRETLVKELLAFKVKITAALNEVYESWRERDHDDLVLAAALACWRAGPLPDDAADELPPAEPIRRLPPVPYY
jgi:hypothetical protein